MNRIIIYDYAEHPSFGWLVECPEGVIPYYFRTVCTLLDVTNRIEGIGAKYEMPALVGYTTTYSLSSTWEQYIHEK